MQNKVKNRQYVVMKQYMKGINFVSPPPALYSTLTTNFIHLVWKGKKVNTLSFIYIIEIQKKVNVKLTGTEFWSSMVSGNTRKCLLTEKNYISTRNWRSDGLGMAITTHSISHLVWTVCMARAPHLSSHVKLSLCSRVITPPPWDASLCSLFHPILTLVPVWVNYTDSRIVWDTFVKHGIL